MKLRSISIFYMSWGAPEDFSSWKSYLLNSRSVQSVLEFGVFVLSIDSLIHRFMQQKFSELYCVLNSVIVAGR